MECKTNFVTTGTGERVMKQARFSFSTYLWHQDVSSLDF